MADKRLIDANWLMELYDMGNELEEYAGVLSVPIPVIRQNIKDAPTVEAVPVVRCAECKKCSHDTMFGTRWCHGHEVKPDDFCSRGERRTDEKGDDS